MFAQQESESASRRIKFGIAESSRKGVFHGTPPFGYNKIKGKLVLNWGFQKIANYLTDQSIPTPRMVSKAKNAGIVWHEHTIEGILKNRHYTGNLAQGRSHVNFDDKKQITEKGYKSRTQVVPEECVICEDTHEPIIPFERFEAVQEKISYRSSRRYCGRGKKSLFARIAYCADCGKGMNY